MLIAALSFAAKKNAIKIYGVIAMIIVWYSAPFVLTFYNDVPFSFGPTGY